MEATNRISWITFRIQLKDKRRLADRQPFRTALTILPDCAYRKQGYPRSLFSGTVNVVLRRGTPYCLAPLNVAGAARLINWEGHQEWTLGRGERRHRMVQEIAGSDSDPHVVQLHAFLLRPQGGVR